MRILDKTDIEMITGKRINNGNAFKFIDGVSTPDRIKRNKIIFLEKADQKQLKAINENCNIGELLIINKNLSGLVNGPNIVTLTPREDYSKIVSELFKYYKTYWTTENEGRSNKYQHRERQGIFIHPSAKVSKNALIYPNVYIGPNCSVGSNTIIKSNTTIGQPGFGIIRKNNNEHIHLPHVGGVKIGKNVEIGAQNTIPAGTIYPTVINDFVKTDDQVHIGHNCIIGKGVILTTNCKISGSVNIGAGSYFGPSVTINNGIRIGKKCFVGVGSVIIEDIEDNRRVINLNRKFVTPEVDSTKD
ncbi:MAG: hypothetical protein CBB97_19290 [Candidatus Endolissoclinum sp. TMED37]|nr:MAG: hypothetical protein CBB97_19290 [Candidatus Endolissoclinum sp. TMED37]|tara:strand:- start:1840 stop:2745 length:906 start_codon:yes stop_codon:yes gene_type:complete